MKKSAFIPAVLFITAALYSAQLLNGGGENYLAYSVRASLLVADPERAADLLTDWAE